MAPPNVEMPELLFESVLGNSGKVVARCLAGAGGTAGKSTDLLVPKEN